MMNARVSSWTDGEVPATLRASQLLEWGTSRLHEVGVETALLDARLLLQHALGLAREDLLRTDVSVSDSAIALYDALIARRIKREPVAKIRGCRGFWKHDFIVSAATLDPRPDSEILLEAALSYRSPEQVRTLLDLGTGTGCLLLSLLGEYENAHGVGVDISEEALKVARENSHRLGMESRAVFQVSDWCDQIDGVFDLILCNPPYIAESDAETLMPEVRRHDPFIALFGGEDGLHAYRTLLPQAKRHMEKNGLMLVEIGAGQAESVSSLALEAGLRVVGQRPDLAGIPRVLILQPN